MKQTDTRRSECDAHGGAPGGAGPGGARPELVGRDAGGRFVGAGGNGSAEAMARMKIGLSQEQKRWVENEAARRHVPKTVIVRELLDRALSGGLPQAGPESAGDAAAAASVVRDVEDLEDEAVAAVAYHAPAGAAYHAGGGAAGVGSAGVGSVRDGVRVPAVEVVGPEPVHDPCGHAGVHGRHPYYHDPAFAAVRSAAPPRGVRPYTDPSRQHVVEERVAVESVRQAVGDPSAGDSSAHTSQLPPGVGVSRARQVPGSHVPVSEALEGLPPGVALPGGMHADVVADGADSKSLVVSGGPVVTESGVW